MRKDEKKGIDWFNTLVWGGIIIGIITFWTGLIIWMKS